MAKQTKNIVIDALAVNYARIASPSAKYETQGKDASELEWKADILVDEDTVEKIENTYPNLRKKMNPITPKKYKQIYKVDMPEGVEGPAILKLTMPVGVAFKDKKTGEDKMMMKPQPKVLLQQGEGKAKEITFDEYIGNGSVGKVMLMHRSTAYNNKPIDVIELGSILLTSLVEVDVKPGRGGNEPDVKDAFGLDEVEESESKAPAPNEASPFNVAGEDDGFADDDFGEDDDTF